MAMDIPIKSFITKEPKSVFFFCFVFYYCKSACGISDAFVSIHGGRKKKKKSVTIAALILFYWEGHLYKHVWIFIVASKVESFLIGKMCQDFFSTFFQKQFHFLAW